jgi:hypothetical protein
VILGPPTGRAVDDADDRPFGREVDPPAHKCHVAGTPADSPRLGVGVTP